MRILKVMLRLNLENSKMVKNGIAPDTLKVVNKDFRNFYKKQTRHIIDKRLHEYDNDRIIQLFLKKVGENLIENRAGVHIDKIGYFFVYRHPFIFPPRIGLPHLKPYMLTFIPTENSIFKYWSMDFKFNRTLMQKMEQNVKKGYRYLNLMMGVTKKEYMYIGAVNSAKVNRKIEKDDI